jgi:vacuolar protein sorting-associated protein 13A/C
MALFERVGARLGLEQLYAEVVSHYTTQALQQSYVLILGLDVLGNPYGLVRDFTRGIGDCFYEPVFVSSNVLCT